MANPFRRFSLILLMFISLCSFISAAAPFTFAIYGDSQSTSRYHAVANIIANNTPSFAVHVGDVVSSLNAKNWAEFVNESSGFYNGTNLYAARGNHDGSSTKSTDYWKSIFNISKTYYSFRKGNIQFIILDTNIKYTKGSEQYVWLEEVLNSSDSLYKFVFMHDIDKLKIFNGLFKNYSVDAVFAGHSHKYQRGYNYGVRSFITGGGGGPSNGGGLDVKEVSDKRNHFIRVDVDELKVNLTAIDSSGNVIDRLSFDKTN